MDNQEEAGSNYARNPTNALWSRQLFQVQLSATIVLGLLFIQFLLGMELNLFATFPETSTTILSGMFSTMMTGPVSTAHLMVGIFLPVLSVVILAILVDTGAQFILTILAIFGLISVAVAGVSGLGFVYSGFDSNMYSYLMAVAFVSAFTSYFVLILSLGRVNQTALRLSDTDRKPLEY